MNHKPKNIIPLELGTGNSNIGQTKLGIGITVIPILLIKIISLKLPQVIGERHVLLAGRIMFVYQLFKNDVLPNISIQKESILIKFTISHYIYIHPGKETFCNFNIMNQFRSRHFYFERIACFLYAMRVIELYRVPSQSRTLVSVQRLQLHRFVTGIGIAGFYGATQLPGTCLRTGFIDTGYTPFAYVIGLLFCRNLSHRCIILSSETKIRRVLFTRQIPIDKIISGKRSPHLSLSAIGVFRGDTVRYDGIGLRVALISVPLGHLHEIAV